MIPNPTRAVVTRSAASGRQMASAQKAASAARTIQVLDGEVTTDASRIASATIAMTRHAVSARRRMSAPREKAEKCIPRSRPPRHDCVIEVREHPRVQLLHVRVECLNELCDTGFAGLDRR